MFTQVTELPVFSSIRRMNLPCDRFAQAQRLTFRTGMGMGMDGRDVSLAIAKKIVFQNWKSKSSCHFTHWTNLITEFILIEETIAHKMNNISAFKETWNPLITFLQAQQLM